MRRWLAVFLLVFLPLQFTWSVAAAYCQHESGNVQHFGHHEHKHAGDAGAKDAKKAPSGIDEDCAFCHAGCGRETGPWLYARELRPSPGV